MDSAYKLLNQLFSVGGGGGGGGVQGWTVRINCSTICSLSGGGGGEGGSSGLDSAYKLFNHLFSVNSDWKHL